MKRSTVLSLTACLLVSVLTSGLAHATGTGNIGSANHPVSGLRCKATRILDSSILEESFSVEEYPDVSIDESEAYLGASRFSVLDGDKIERLPTVGFTTMFQIKPKVGYETFLVTVSRTEKTGEILIPVANQEPRVLAKLSCE